MTSVRGVFLLAAVGLSLGCTGERAEAEPAPGVPAGSPERPQLRGTRVEVVVVTPTNQTLRLRVPGEVKGERDALLSSALGGYIESVDAREGDEVKRGAVLARIDSQTHTTRLLRAQVELQAAERELKRDESLRGSIAEAQIDATRDRLASAKATLRELQLNVERSLIKAPFAGAIVRSDAEVGEVAAPGTPLFRLVQLDPVQVSIALSDRDIGMAKVGTLAKVELDARSGVFDGKVLRVSRAAELKTRSFEAIIEVENSDHAILPGMIAQVTLEANTKDLANGAPEGKPSEIMISQDWLVTDPDGVGVFVAEAGPDGTQIAKWRPVTLGPVVRRQVTVEKGLDAGDVLVIVGHRTLSEGDPIIVHRKGLCCEDGRPIFGRELAQTAPASREKGVQASK